jgi:dihydrofolate synthase/folylpolyglutamate synthase
MYPTFFEALTAIAFACFADEKADIVVCEVGMGGRFDSTNVLPADIQVITKIGLEHTQFLGKTYEEIASEKAGIIKRDGIVISARQKERAMEVIGKKAKEKKAKLYTYRKDFTVRRTAVSPCGQEFNFYAGKERLLSLKTPLLGRHQMENMALAVQTVRLLGKMKFPVEREALYEGVSTTVWPCRFQVLKEKPVIVIDGAHNPDGMRTLSGTLREVFPGKQFSFLTGILKDKDWRQMLRILLLNNNIGEIDFTKPDTERSLDPEILAGFVRGRRTANLPRPLGERGRVRGKRDIHVTVIPAPSAAFRYIRKTKKDWCICGSLYLCGDILSCLPARDPLSAG